MSGNYKHQRTDRAQFLIDNLNLPQASGIELAKWEHFQLAFLNDEAIFRIENKSRQIAYSFTTAAEAVADAILAKRDSIFSSINLEEAKEKIRYANAVYENLEIAGLPRKVIDNQLNIEFSNGARLTSFPARAVRGRPKSNWYGDEFAHIQRDREIYKGSVPIITKGGRIRLGSSPLAASGTFWEIFTESFQKYADYVRKTTPWWEVQAFCKNVREARRLAPSMPTAHRVELFATDRLKTIFANYILEDFQNEFECLFIDERTAWITWDEIRAAENDNYLCLTADSVQTAFEIIDRLAAAVREGEVEAVLYGGADIGRTRHTTEIILVGKTSLESFPLRLMISLGNCDFDAQEAVFEKILTTLPVAQMLIDKTGLGIQLAENMERRFPLKAIGVIFTNPLKELWATNAKMLFQQAKVIIPVNRELGYQIHSIKRIVTTAKNLVFDTVKNEKHHADKFWGLALALQAANEYVAIWDDGMETGSYQSY